MVDARPRKHSLTLHGHRTSVSLEEPFWRAFLQIAEEEGKTINGLAAEIDDARMGDPGLASAIRLFVLDNVNAAPVLHLICGKIASGKSTLAAALGQASNTVIISEDEWLAALFGDELSTIQDYVRCVAKLETALGPHISSLLRAGVSVVLDFHANTIARRAWMRDIFQAANVAHKLHYLEVPDEVCIARLRARNAQGDHPFAASEAEFRQVSKHFVAPTAVEGFDVVRHSCDEG
jgi:predicted DNA-binding ribbon-helix-helix protein